MTTLARGVSHFSTRETRTKQSPRSMSVLPSVHPARYDDGDDMGYRDHGGELWDEEDFAHGTDSNAARRAQRGAGGAMGARRARMKKMPKKRISSLFTGGTVPGNVWVTDCAHSDIVHCVILD